MQQFIESQWSDVSKSVKNGPYVPTILVNGVSQPKPKDVWNVDHQKKILHDKKVKNILTSSLEMDEFLKVYHYQIAKEILETLEVTHEGTEELEKTQSNHSFSRI